MENSLVLKIKYKYLVYYKISLQQVPMCRKCVIKDINTNEYWQVYCNDDYKTLAET